MMTFVLMQLAVVGAFMAWYAKRHPSDASKMFMELRRRMSR